MTSGPGHLVAQPLLRDLAPPQISMYHLENDPLTVATQELISRTRAVFCIPSDDTGEMFFGSTAVL